ncbi:MAG: phosphoserine transaminase [Aestuariivita sp.]|nr:phosphoserine transaminase [Aestuariivita sp.]
MSLTYPAERPSCPYFSSGPCKKPSNFNLSLLQNAALSRSHRASVGKLKLKAAIEETRDLLNIPSDFKIGIVPASDTGAFEMAMWNLLGPREVEMLSWESFGSGWVTDCVNELKLKATVKVADYGNIVDLSTVNWDRDVCFTWNGTTSGVRIPSGNIIPANRAGLTICDATSAVFAMDIPWKKLDATTFSWQKVLGGEAAHGMLILSPQAIERLQSYSPTWPIPKIFRLTKNNSIIDSIFEGSTINTPSMLVVEDYLNCLAWARSVGGLSGLIARANKNAKAIWDFCDEREWIDNLAKDKSTRSNTSVCLQFTDTAISNDAEFAKVIAKKLEKENIAFDINAYRDAPPGLRIWCGGTVETSDIKTMLLWLEWAYENERASRRFFS